MSLSLQSPVLNAYANGTATVSTTALAVSNVAFGFSAAELLIPGGAIVSAATNPINFTIDGTTPTATVGHPIAAGEKVEIVGKDNVTNLQVIRSGGSDSTVSITLMA